ncbi:MAG: DUF4093 domain-containing protein [Clostridia bacterium]|nr:DUF4093 domain-containing protein [Clostridia bacterium]
MISIKEAVIVEGKFDKARVAEVCDALIITTDGFTIFKDKRKKEFLKALAERQGLLVLTDSDRAGFLIRLHLKSFIPNEYIKHAYIPAIEGKERRKRTPSKEGILGVEGMDAELLENILKEAATVREVKAGEKITKSDLYEVGLSGKSGSAVLRRAFARELSLPPRLSANALLEILNAAYSREEFFEIVNKSRNTG